MPKLEDTLKKYVYFSEPMVSTSEHAATKAAVEAFGKGEGVALQAELVELDKKAYTSFYNKMWFEMYLEGRDGLAINVNPQVTWKDDPVASKNEQAVRAADLIASSLRFYRTLQDEKMTPEIFHTEPAKSKTNLYELACRFSPRKVAFYTSYLFGAYPLDMSQYGNLFSSTRIPLKGKDSLKKASPNESRHVVVQRGNAFYALPVLLADGSVCDHATIEKGLRAILADRSGQAAAVHSIGVLTAANRDLWAGARAALEKSPSNAAALHAIDSALFAVCLDDASPSSSLEVNHTMLTGDGRNRWFDKSFQVIVCANGKASVNFEHSWGDGVAVLRYFNEVFTDSQSAHARKPATEGLPAVAAQVAEPHAGVPRRLAFDVSAEVQDAIASAGKALDSQIRMLDVGIFETAAWSKKDLKKLNIGADGFMQMGFQLAHRRMRGFTPSTYESASTAAFKHGRTETIRSATPEAAAFAALFADPSSSKEARAAALKTAVKRHGEITKDALMGKGVDRHLFAMRKLAEKKGGPLPHIYQDKAYKVLSNIVLSTSTLSSDALFAGGFGPVGQDCFALPYGVADDGARTAITSYGLGSQEFARQLDLAYLDMIQALRTNT